MKIRVRSLSVCVLLACALLVPSLVLATIWQETCASQDSFNSSGCRANGTTCGGLCVVTTYNPACGVCVSGSYVDWCINVSKYSSTPYIQSAPCNWGGVGNLSCTCPPTLPAGTNGAPRTDCNCNP